MELDKEPLECYTLDRLYILRIMYVLCFSKFPINAGIHMYKCLLAFRSRIRIEFDQNAKGDLNRESWLGMK